MAKSKAKVVVASKEGHYGGKLRQIGEQFVLSEPDKQFSKNWMVDPEKDKKNAEALKEQYKQAGGQQVPQDQIEAELAQAGDTGAAAKRKIAELEKENTSLKEENARLQEQLHDLQGVGNPPAAETPDGVAQSEQGSEDTSTDEGAGETKTDDEEKPQRATRRRRSS